MDEQGNVATVALFLVTCIAWVALEAWMVVTNRPTISARVRALYRANPDTGVMAALCTGLLISHFFFSERGRD
jgi:hypothetical protein